MKKNGKSKDLVKAEAAFPALAQDPQAIVAAMAENLGGQAITPFDLDRVTIPAGGGLAWSVPTLEGEKPQAEITGIIIGVQNARAYWAQTIEASGGNLPPDCISDDAVTGVGNPGGECRVCPFAQFGSDAKQRGQACKHIQRLFVLRAEAMLPLVVNLPPTSLKGAKKYLLRLVSNGKRASSVVTKIALERDKSADGIVYSKAAFAMVGELDAAQAATAAAYAAAFAPAFKRVDVQDFKNPDIPL